jgi:molybdenum cofactor cytidylyltransferase
MIPIAGDTTLPQPFVGAVLLAAGAGSRMGHRPKCLLELDGTPLIRRLIGTLLDAGVHELVVVLGHHAERIAPVIGPLPVTVVRNPDPQAGQNTSLHIGLRALSHQPAAVLVALADQPLIRTQDISDLISAYNKRPTHTQVVQPQVHGLPGNPVVFSAAVREQILSGDIRNGCRQWQAAHPEAVHRWVTTNQHYRADVDTLDDIEALAASTGDRLCWPADLTVKS